MQGEWIAMSERDVAALRRRSKGVTVLPLGSIESHGPHLPLGSDPLVLRSVVRRMAEQEPVAVLPELPYSFVLEATRRPGAIHIESGLLMDLVENICDEAARNGFRKIVLIHGHGGNVALHWMFCKRILERGKPYAVYSIPPLPDMGEFFKTVMDTEVLGHACEMETSMVMAVEPTLVRMDRLHGRVYRSGRPPDVGPAFTTVEWVSRWPEMPVGEPACATADKGEKIVSEWVDRLVAALRKIKRDRVVLRVMREFAAERRQGGTLKRYGGRLR